MNHRVTPCKREYQEDSRDDNQEKYTLCGIKSKGKKKKGTVRREQRIRGSKWYCENLHRNIVRGCALV